MTSHPWAEVDVCRHIVFGNRLLTSGYELIVKHSFFFFFLIQPLVADVGELFNVVLLRIPCRRVISSSCLVPLSQSLSLLLPLARLPVL